MISFSNKLKNLESLENFNKICGEFWNFKRYVLKDMFSFERYL
jgi:hypothetical protein